MRKRNTYIQNRKLKLQKALYGYGSLVLFVGLLFGVRVILTARVATIGDELRRMEDEKQVLVESINIMRSQIAQESSLSVLEIQATERMGMVPLGTDIVFIDATSVVSDLSYLE